MFHVSTVSAKTFVGAYKLFIPIPHPCESVSPERPSKNLIGMLAQVGIRRRLSIDPTIPSQIQTAVIVSVRYKLYRNALHDRAWDATAGAIIGAETGALPTLRLDDGAGGGGDGGRG